MGTNKWFSKLDASPPCKTDPTHESGSSWLKASFSSTDFGDCRNRYNIIAKRKMTDRIKMRGGGGSDIVDDDSKSLQNKGRRHSERGHQWSISISARCVQHHRRYYYHIGIQVLDTAL